MNSDDPLIRLVAERNPVPDADALTGEERATADALRERISRSAPDRVGGRRRMRHLAIASAGVVPVVVVLALVLGVRGSVGPASRGGGHGALTVANPGAAQTLLVIGSDHRAGEPYRFANTDTILLVRLTPGASTVTLLSVPRDLEVQIGQGGTSETAKINSAYGVGGPFLLSSILRTQVFPGLRINHIIDLNFAGFADIVNALGCVDSDVDRRYYNNTAQTDYSSIDIQPGYQPLCGTQALQFVRFRHTDSDIVRDARQRDFVDWLKGEYPVSDLIAHRDQLVKIFGEHAQTDAGLHSLDGVLNLFEVALGLARDPVRQIPFPAIFGPCGGTGTANGVANQAPCYVTATRAGEAAAYRDFLAPSRRPASRPAAPATRPSAAGMIADPADGQAQAAALSGSGLPVYYPTRIRAGSEYCSSTTANCDEYPNPQREYAGAYPRQYTIDADGRSYPSYRMTLVINSALGEYYGVQATTWLDPPILRNPTRTQDVDGRQLQEYGDGTRLSLVAFHTATATYWISNTLTDTIPAAQLIAIAASMRLAG
jgi:LCP family protein required for cell wall assembly